MAEVRIHVRVRGADIDLPTDLDGFRELTKRRRVCSPGACDICKPREGDMAEGEDVKLHPNCRCSAVYVNE